MPRDSRKAQIDSGILGSAVACELLGISRNTVKKLCDNKGIKRFRVVNFRTLEFRISALDLLLYCLRDTVLFKRELVEAAANYCREYQPSHLPYIEEVLSKYGTVSLVELCNIPLTPAPDERPEWDAAGNIIQ